MVLVLWFLKTRFGLGDLLFKRGMVVVLALVEDMVAVTVIVVRGVWYYTIVYELRQK